MVLTRGCVVLDLPVDFEIGMRGAEAGGDVVKGVVDGEGTDVAGDVGKY